MLTVEILANLAPRLIVIATLSAGNKETLLFTHDVIIESSLGKYSPKFYKKSK
jgi:hypothetical protein